MIGPAGRELTPEQAAAVEMRNGPLFLFANAGSGKTAVLVERFVRAVREDGVDPSAILAITYTEKAAGELQERIRNRFIAGNDREHARAAEAAFISTIHGFCSRVLRSHPFRAGIDPGYRVLDAAESGRLSIEAFEDALEKLLDESEQSLETIAAYTPDKLQAMVVAAYGRLRSRGETDPQLPELDRPPVPHAEGQILDRARIAATHELVSIDSPGVAVIRALDALERSGEYLTALEAGSLPSPEDNLDAFKVGKQGNALKAEALDAYRDALDLFKRACGTYHAYDSYVMLRRLLALYGGRYASLKRERGGLDFEDLQLRARDLLRDDEAIRRRYCESFAHIMVDEFQDTNPLQYEILELIQNDNLFTVGDEFQSIYGFRHADVGVFRRRREDAEEAGRARSLAINFRARGEVMTALNAAYSEVFDEGFVPLREGRDDVEPRSDPCIDVLLTDYGGWEDYEPEQFGRNMPAAPVWRLAEARMLAHRVRELVDGPEFDAGDVAVLLRAKSDMAVYERALEDLGIPTYVVGGQGYWSQQQVSDLVAYLTALVNPEDELALYGVLASPLVGVSSDTLTLVGGAARGLGRGVWWTLSEAFLNDGDGSDGLADRVPACDIERLHDFCEYFSAERGTAARSSLETLIDRVVNRFEYDLAVLSMPAGERRMANVRKLMRLAREFEAAEGRDLRRFIKYVGTQEIVQTVEGEAPLESEGLDAVRIMTIHSAKGLEFPVVCVADLGRRGRGDYDALRISDDGRVGLQLVSLGGGKAATMDYDDIGQEELVRQEEEERRIFYVAMTRAREHLVLSGAFECDRWPEPAPLGKPMAWVLRSFVPNFKAAFSPEEPQTVVTCAFEDDTAEIRCLLNSAETLGVVLPAAALAPEAPERLAGGAESARPTDLSEVPIRSVPMVNRLSYSALESYARCGYRFYLEKVLGLKYEPLAVTGDEAIGHEGEPGAVEMTGLLRGAIVHELLEHLDFAAPAVPSREAIAELARQHGAKCADADCDAMAELVERFVRSDLCRRLSAADATRKEVPFAFVIRPAVPGAQGLLVNGVVDVYASEGARTVVVDYKSDRLNGRSPTDLMERRYSTQRLVYALAALEDEMETVEVTYCFLDRPDQPETAVYLQKDRLGLMQDLERIAASLLKNEFNVTADPYRALCEHCPGQKALCSWRSDMTLRSSPIVDNASARTEGSS